MQKELVPSIHEVLLQINFKDNNWVEKLANSYFAGKETHMVNKHMEEMFNPY